MKATGNFEAVRDVDPMVVLSDQTRARIDHWVAKFPPDRKRSAVIQGLFAAQEQNLGWLSDELIAAVARYLDLPTVWAYEVATFYSMFELGPVGRHNVAICTNISCWLNGAEDLVRHCEAKLACKLGESTADGRVYLKREEECLAACAGAPMMVVNGHYVENLDIQKIDAILDGLTIDGGMPPGLGHAPHATHAVPHAEPAPASSQHVQLTLGELQSPASRQERE